MGVPLSFLPQRARWLAYLEAVLDFDGVERPFGALPVAGDDIARAHGAAAREGDGSARASGHTRNAYAGLDGRGAHPHHAVGAWGGAPRRRGGTGDRGNGEAARHGTDHCERRSERRPDARAVMDEGQLSRKRTKEIFITMGFYLSHFDRSFRAPLAGDWATRHLGSSTQPINTILKNVSLLPEYFLFFSEEKTLSPGSAAMCVSTLP